MIELKGITKIYDDGGDAVVRALSGVSLTAEQGEMIAIIGASGSGKSTLLNIIGCLDEKTRGKYYLNGKDIDAMSDSELAVLRNAVFGYVLQEFAIIEDWTVYQNVVLPLDYSRKSGQKNEQRIDALLEKLGIYEKKHVPARKLSGGQRQRVSIARALVNDPDIILADEPTGALDKANGLEVMSILSGIRDEGKTVIIVTHDMNIAGMCSRIIRIEDGKVADRS